MRTYELTPKFDRAQSFYRRAYVKETETGSELWSYDTKICELVILGLDDYEVIVYEVFDADGNCLTYSSTSLRHLKEFLAQNGVKAETKSQIHSDYTIKEVYK